MSFNNRNARNAKVQRAPTTRERSGDVAPYVREQDERRLSDMSMKPHLVLAEEKRDGEAFVRKMGWRFDRAAIITQAEYLSGLSVDPGEDVWAINELRDPDFFMHLQECMNDFKPGESINLRMVRI